MSGIREVLNEEGDSIARVSPDQGGVYISLGVGSVMGTRLSATEARQLFVALLSALAPDDLWLRQAIQEAR